MKIELDMDLQKRLTRKYWRLTRLALAKTRQQVLDMAEHTDPDRLKLRVAGLMDEKPMKELIESLWSEVGGRVANDMESLLLLKKSDLIPMEKKAKKEDWYEKMKRYAAERSAKKIESIMTAEVEAINKVIDGVLETSLNDGMGIIETRKLLKNSIEGNELLSIENWQAQRIAMTEVGSAQNTGSYLAAQEYGINAKKEWLFIPGLKSFREEHRGFQALGPVDMGYEYAPGLKHPGDPNGSAEQVINCYCSIGYSV